MSSNQFRLVKGSTQSNLCTSCWVVDRASAPEGNAQTCIPSLTWINNFFYTIMNESEQDMDHLRTRTGLVTPLHNFD